MFMEVRPMVSSTKASFRAERVTPDALCFILQHLHSNSIGCSGVNIHEALFVTNPALGNQTIIAPLSYDAERRVGGMNEDASVPPFPLALLIFQGLVISSTPNYFS
jgi:hypothetical protein